MNAPWPFPAGGLLEVGLEVVPAETTIRTKVGRGPHRQRSLGTGFADVMRGEIVLTGAQLAVFDAWGKGLLAGWALPFTWVEPAVGAVGGYQFTAAPKRKLITAGEWAYRAWRVTMDLEVV